MIGFYDLVNNNFKSNQGTGVFTKGTDVTQNTLFTIQQDLVDLEQKLQPQIDNKVSLTGNETIQGTKTFETRPLVGATTPEGVALQSEIPIIQANPQGTAQQSLTKININNTVYSIEGGSGGVAKNDIIEQEDILPTATEETPDIIQYNNKNYTKKKVINLSNTTWLLNDSLNLLEDTLFSINFTSNNINFEFFNFSTTSGNTTLIYTDTNSTNTVNAYSGQTNTWADNTYKTIAITNGTDINKYKLYDWLTKNGTIQSGTAISYSYVEMGRSTVTMVRWS